MTTIRVFPRHTKFTPTDSLAFVGSPPELRPEADKVDISVTFTWDIPQGFDLMREWQQYYPVVSIGGPAFSSPNGSFEPGCYIKEGVTFTTRGCNNQCPWCFVPEREGRLTTIEVQPGHIIQDNNLLQANWQHIEQVFEMLKKQKRAAVFSGGLDSRLITDKVADALKGLRIQEVFLAADTKAALRPLEKAVSKLSFLRSQTEIEKGEPARKLRCYVLIGYGGETFEQATARLERVWEIGCLPFAQLYQPLNRWIDYPTEWRRLARTWSRPAAMFAEHKAQIEEVLNERLVFSSPL